MSSPAEQGAIEMKSKPLDEREFMQKCATESVQNDTMPLKEGRRQFRLNKLARETPEETKARRAHRAERQRVSRAKRAARNIKRTPEDTRRRREYKRNRRHRIAASETAEEKAVRLATRREKRRVCREKQLAQETPKQSAKRRAPALEKQKLLQQKRRAIMYATETPEDRAARSLLISKRLKPYRKREKSTPAENEKRAMERKLCAKVLAPEKPKQIVAWRVRAAEKELCSLRAKQNTSYQTSEKLKDAEHEAIDESFHSSGCFSFSGLSEGGNSVTTTESSGTVLTTTNEFSLAEQNPEEASVVKNEDSLDSWPCVGGSQQSSVAKITFQDNRDFESSQGGNCKSFARNKNTWKEKTKTAKQKTVLEHNLSFVQTPSADDCLAYGNFIAQRISKSNRNDVEIKYAKALIKDILLNLSTGVYSHLIPDKPIEVVERKMSESLPSFAIIAPIQQDIIVKEEVDL